MRTLYVSFERGVCPRHHVKCPKLRRVENFSKFLSVKFYENSVGGYMHTDGRIFLQTFYRNDSMPKSRDESDRAFAT
jgi:hypothetical protein